ncbi:hypothetical protein C3L33_04526, partial [Rhododendron williamsianum]
MFFHMVLERNMQLHPRHFGRDLREKLVAKLMKDVEGTCRFSFQQRPTWGFSLKQGQFKFSCRIMWLIPDDMEFQSGDMPNYTTSDRSVKIEKESEVRLKIIGTRVDATEIFCIGTIKDDFLGVLGGDQ